MIMEKHGKKETQDLYSVLSTLLDDQTTLLKDLTPVLSKMI